MAPARWRDPGAERIVRLLDTQISIPDEPGILDRLTVDQAVTTFAIPLGLGLVSAIVHKPATLAPSDFVTT